MGYQILAVSPDKPERVRATAEKGGYESTLLSDSEMKGARAFGIAFRIPDELFNRYKSRFNLDLEEHSGQTHHELPVPSVFIVGKDGRIQFEYVNPDYRVRLHPDVLLAAAKAGLEGEK